MEDTKPTAAQIIAGKDRIIGELYSKLRGLEDAYMQLVKQLKEKE